MKLLSSLFLGMALLLFAGSLEANNAMLSGSSLSGYVYDESNEEPLIGATVLIDGSKLGAYTNKLGYFSISGIPNGTQKVKISYIGYETKEVNIKFKDNSVRKDFMLKTDEILTEEVVVSAAKQAEKRRINISRVNVPIQQIKEIRIGGEADVFRSLQYLPGILTSSQISSGLFVRGGSPDQNLVLLDGATVYNPSHLFGFISTFNPEAIKDVDLIKGGFQAEYGGRLSAVLNLTQKDGNKKEFEGVASLGAISSRLSLEGPIGNGSWFLGGRRTYFELIKSFVDEDPTDPLPDFGFYDLNAKVSQNLGKNDKLFISGFMTQDKLEYGSYGLDLTMTLGNRTGAMRWTHIFSDNLFAITNVTASHYQNELDLDNSGFVFTFTNSIADYTAKFNLEWFTSDDLTTKFGAELSRYTFEYINNYTGEADGDDEEEDLSGRMEMKVHDWHMGTFAQVNWNVDEDFTIQTGLRGNYFQEADAFRIDPRFAVRYRPFANWSFKASWGLYTQSLRLASNPDFSFFDTWLPTDSTLDLSDAIHYVFSVETEPWEGYDLSFDTYYKVMHNISELDNTALNIETADDVFMVGDAEAYGIEIFLQKKFGRLTGWAGYALGWISNKFPEVNFGKEYRPKYDRRHDFKVVLQYELTKSWDIGATFTFQSGQSYTGASSRFQLRPPGMKTGRGVTYPTQKFGLRLPPSHQLNLSATHKFTTFGLDSKLIIDIFNVYNRRDIWFRYADTDGDVTKYEDVKLLPILPTISYELKF